ncbi:hypothetical protein DEO72_LG3g1517 [Vigna unguiculata]|uniref:Uncharacterized protein n=1 Tax=Vigna unguiculata TaxID=3917 RepID=A0A4D6LEY6_VIGUN|nr:hypothetical protein DEO72_LG3g1517 [Vigna unguiculata]
MLSATSCSGETTSPKRDIVARWGRLSEAEGLAWARVPSLSEFMRVVFGLEGLSPIGVWDVLGGWTHDGQGTGKLFKSRPSEFISSKRELQHLIFGYVLRFSPRRMGFGLGDGHSRIGESGSPKRDRKEVLGEARWGRLSEAEGLAWARVPSLSEFMRVVFGLEGLSPIGVWDVLGGWTHDGQGTG